MGELGRVDALGAGDVLVGPHDRERQDVERPTLVAPGDAGDDLGKGRPALELLLGRPLDAGLAGAGENGGALDLAERAVGVGRRHCQAHDTVDRGRQRQLTGRDTGGTGPGGTGPGAAAGACDCEAASYSPHATPTAAIIALAVRNPPLPPRKRAARRPRFRPALPSAPRTNSSSS
ncbi:MAG: hypothetical protein R2708_20080 [Vicinamibacterales bacterium]